MANNALGLRALTNLSTQLKVTDKAFRNAVRKNLRAGVKAAGQPVLDAIKARAEEQGLHSAAAATAMTIRYKTTGASIRIQTNAKKAPMARPYEMGNKHTFNEVFVAESAARLNAGRRQPVSRRKAIADARKRHGAAAAGPNQLRHPVYHAIGDPGGFATVPTRPYFMPGVKDKGKDIDKTMEKVVIQTARDAGFK